MKALLGFASFCGRHFVALLVTVAAAGIVWTIVYFALLLWAVFSNGGLGGPFAYPAGLLFAVVATAVAGLIFFLPSTGFAEWIARRRGLPILAQIPISVASLVILCAVAVSVARVIRHEDFALKGFLGWIGFLVAVQLLPLGLYWWTAQAGPLMLSILQRFRLKKDAVDTR
jgi:hypothetical protein